MRTFLHRHPCAGALLGLLVLTAAARGAEPVAPPARIGFRALQPGVEYARVDLAGQPGAGQGELHLVRLDPAVAPLRLLLAGELQLEPRSAADWAREHQLSVVANLGMFATDGRTHVGHVRRGQRLHSATWVKSYHQALVLGPRRAGLAPARLLDLDRAPERALLEDYAEVVQNLRLIRGAGENAWPQGARRWSEVALAEDDQGRLLLVFLRAPRSMHAFNRLLLDLPLGVRRAQHLEGGPEASLSVHAGGLDLDLCGSFETGFLEDESNRGQWPIPNVLGVARPAGEEQR
ncbi:MAG TPA: phosphodiester glycosidase family protein [Myxococcota bacterium]|nr:phosphodiester glycosidase family protein [Myxococcota bacterium]HRY94507.1 phosphodiester glycosidase family protein [Myxococcota bacterium]HSA21576.1 phosphodiester glycosidase family protein [Myxococcota bacterium]